MIRLSSLFVAFGLTGALGTPACGGDDTSPSSGSGPLSSGLPKDQTIGSSTDADIQKLCDAIGEYVANDPGLRAAECHLAGVGAAAAAAFFGGATDAQIQKACSDLESTCMNQLPSGADAGSSTCQKPAGACTVTAGELEACISDSLAALKAGIAQVPSCATIRAADIGMGSGTSNAPTPASCQVVNDKCPGALQSTGVAPGGGTTGN